MAWKSGEITVYNDDEGEVVETGLVHTGGLVVFLLWNSTGTRLVSGDEVSDPLRWALGVRAWKPEHLSTFLECTNHCIGTLKLCHCNWYMRLSSLVAPFSWLSFGSSSLNEDSH